MSKELEAFERLKEGDSPSAPRDIEIVERALKALDIIKNKPFDSNYLYSTEYKYYYEVTSLDESVKLTKEEYDLLKEVLL